MGLIDQIGQAQVPKHLGPVVKAAVVLVVAGGRPNAMRCIQIGQRGNVVRLGGHIAIHQIPGQDDEIGLGRIGALDHLAHIKRVVDGAGVQIGNHRNAINRKSVGVPVISLGVPTVVDAATIVSDAMTEFISALSLSDLQKLDERERQELARELLSPQLNGLFVTPKNIDDSIKNLSFLISEGLNIALLGDKEE